MVMAHQKCYHTCSAVNDVLMLWRAILLTATTCTLFVGDRSMVPSICKGLLDAIGTRREQQCVSDTYRLCDEPTVTERPQGKLLARLHL